MLADVEVNATVYVQPTASGLVHGTHSMRIYHDRMNCGAKQPAFTGGRPTACCCAFVFVVVFVIGVVAVGIFAMKVRETLCHEMRNDLVCAPIATVCEEHIADFLLEQRKAHRFASEVGDEVT
jgi:hypothetical protein